MTLDLAGIFAGVIISLLCLVPLRELKKEYSPILTATISVVLVSVAFKRARPLFYYVQSLSGDTAEVYFDVIFKSFGIAVLTNLVSEICGDFGVSSLSGKVDFIGKLAIIMTCIPLVEKMMLFLESLI